MGSKTISVSDDAYARLFAAKRPGESFSDVVKRLTTRRSLSELGEAFSPKEAAGLAEAIHAASGDRRGRGRAG